MSSSAGASSSGSTSASKAVISGACRRVLRSSSLSQRFAVTAFAASIVWTGPRRSLRWKARLKSNRSHPPAPRPVRQRRHRANASGLRGSDGFRADPRASVCSLRLRITANRQAVSFAVRNIAPLACVLDAVVHHTTKQGLKQPILRGDLHGCGGCRRGLAGKTAAPGTARWARPIGCNRGYLRLPGRRLPGRRSRSCRARFGRRRAARAVEAGAVGQGCDPDPR